MMNNWQETCSKQLVRLEKASVLADKLITLCNKAQATISPELIKAIEDERPRLERQLERLRANRFEVAVIGLEKAGKSALLNAWLGQEIPAKLSPLKLAPMNLACGGCFDRALTCMKAK